MAALSSAATRTRPSRWADVPPPSRVAPCRPRAGGGNKVPPLPRSRPQPVVVSKTNDDRGWDQLASTVNAAVAQGASAVDEVLTKSASTAVARTKTERRACFLFLVGAGVAGDWRRRRLPASPAPRLAGPGWRVESLQHQRCPNGVPFLDFFIFSGPCRRIRQRARRATVFEHSPLADSKVGRGRSPRRQLATVNGAGEEWRPAPPLLAPPLAPPSGAFLPTLAKRLRVKEIPCGAAGVALC